MASDEDADYIQVLECTVFDAQSEVESLLRKVKMGTYNPDIDGTLAEILERLEMMLRD